MGSLGSAVGNVISSIGIRVPCETIADVNANAITDAVSVEM